MTFLKERIPLVSYFLLSGGFALSGAALQSEASLLTLLSFAGTLLFFVELRLMDEVKDFDKDQIAHPQRPLPRGVLKISQVRHAIHFLIFKMLILSFVFFALSPLSGTLFTLVTLHLWLMYREFYVGSWLEKRPLLYAISHQLILIPLCLFNVSLAPFVTTITSSSMAWALMVLGLFFSYEVCRKLDPQAHPILKTYLHVYGVKGSGWILATLSLINLLAAPIVAKSLGVSIALVVALGLAPCSSFIGVFAGLKNHKKYKSVETVATLALALILWLPFLAKVIQ